MSSSSTSFQRYVVPPSGLFTIHLIESAAWRERQIGAISACAFVAERKAG